MVGAVQGSNGDKVLLTMLADLCHVVFLGGFVAGWFHGAVKLVVHTGCAGTA